jgi:Flp pilus assembly protein TadD
MSLLIRALKEAEDKRNAGAGPREWSLEPMRENGDNPPGKAAVNPAHGASGLRAGFRLSIIPITLLIAGIMLLAYGVYVYFLTRPPTPIVPPSLPQVASRTTPIVAAHEVKPFIPVVQDKIPTPAKNTAQAEVITPIRKSTPAKKTRSTPVQSTLPTSHQFKVQTPDVDPVLNQRLQTAYVLYQNGRYSEAMADYRSVLEELPGNQDALLGMGASALATGQREEAARWYARVLNVDPDNRLARTALLYRMDGQQSSAPESRLKQWLTEPGADTGERAFLYYSLANLQARQGRWADAQQNYFDAITLQPQRPEYQYDLAVSLDHLGQYPAALEQYRNTLKLLAEHPTPSLDLDAVNRRVTELEAITGTP